MRLTQFSDFGLRVLIHLALCEGRRATIAEIADHHAVSRSHLMKVVPELVRNGWVHSERGRGGGLVLAQPPEAISIGAVVRALEGPPELVACRQPGGRCVISPACRLADLFDEASEAFHRVLDSHHLGDITQPQQPLRQLLALGAA